MSGAVHYCCHCGERVKMAYNGKELLERAAAKHRGEDPGNQMETLVSVIADRNTGSVVELYYHNGCVDKSEPLMSLIDADVRRDTDAVMVEYENLVRRCHSEFPDLLRLKGMIHVRRNCNNSPNLTLRSKRSWGLAVRRR